MLTCDAGDITWPEKIGRIYIKIRSYRALGKVVNSVVLKHPYLLRIQAIVDITTFVVMKGTLV